VGWSAQAKAVWRSAWSLRFAGLTVVIADHHSAPVDLVAFDARGLELIAVVVGETVPKPLAKVMAEVPAPIGTRRSVYVWRPGYVAPQRTEIGTSAAGVTASTRPVLANGSRP
jgi:hypothetical protein